ncbi:MAG: epoxyqueuosine reductase [Clostridia bacterium]|nr:epoxyqueuosine reductase [Clostridia bacterium]
MTDKIKQIFVNNNIDSVGFCPFAEVEDKLLECRAKQHIVPDCKTVITFLLPYYFGEFKGNLCRYSSVPDYHIVAGEYIQRIIGDLKQLFPEHSFYGFCDNSPIPEVYAAAVSGLGVIGKNGLLINEKYGSFVFIADIVTDLDIGDYNIQKPKDCENCGACEKACAAGDIFDKSKCLSKITQQKAELTSEQKELIKKSGVIWGCDACQNVCPHNKNLPISALPEFMDIKPSFCAGDSIEGRAFAYRGRKVIERNFNLIMEEN